MAKNIQGIISGAEKQGERIRHRWGLRERVVWNCVYINSSGSEKSSLVRFSLDISISKINIIFHLSDIKIKIRKQHTENNGEKAI